MITFWNYTVRMTAINNIKYYINENETRRNQNNNFENFRFICTWVVYKLKIIHSCTLLTLVILIYRVLYLSFASFIRQEIERLISRDLSSIITYLLQTGRVFLFLHNASNIFPDVLFAYFLSFCPLQSLVTFYWKHSNFIVPSANFRITIISVLR